MLKPRLQRLSHKKTAASLSEAAVLFDDKKYLVFAIMIDQFLSGYGSEGCLLGQA